jgi:hypothetical protein
VQCLEESHQCSRLCGSQIFSVSRHVAAALDYLADELILRELNGDSIQLRTTLTSRAAQRVAVVALLYLKNERALPLQGRTPFQVLRWNWITAPRIHYRTPRRIASQVCECTERDRDQQNRKNRYGTAFPALLTFP